MVPHENLIPYVPMRYAALHAARTHAAHLVTYTHTYTHTQTNVCVCVGVCVCVCACVTCIYMYLIPPPHTHTHISPQVRVYDTTRNQDFVLSRPFSLLPAAATAQTQAHLQHLPTCMRQQTAACVSGCLPAVYLPWPPRPLTPLALSLTLLHSALHSRSRLGKAAHFFSNTFAVPFLFLLPSKATILSTSKVGATAWRRRVWDALLRLSSGSIKALSRLYQGSSKALLGALLRVYQGLLFGGESEGEFGTRLIAPALSFA